MKKYVIAVGNSGYVNERDWECVLSIHDATVYATKAMAEHKVQSWALAEKLEVVDKSEFLKNMKAYYCN